MPGIDAQAVCAPTTCPQSAPYFDVRTGQCTVSPSMPLPLPPMQQRPAGNGLAMPPPRPNGNALPTPYNALPQ
jgi:hypothetical protein